MNTNPCKECNGNGTLVGKGLQCPRCNGSGIAPHAIWGKEHADKPLESLQEKIMDGIAPKEVSANFMQVVPGSDMCLNGHPVTDKTVTPWRCGDKSCKHYSRPLGEQTIEKQYLDDSGKVYRIEGEQTGVKEKHQFVGEFVHTCEICSMPFADARSHYAPGEALPTTEGLGGDEYSLPSLPNQELEQILEQYRNDIREQASIEVGMGELFYQNEALKSIQTIIAHEKQEAKRQALRWMEYELQMKLAELESTEGEKE